MTSRAERRERAAAVEAIYRLNGVDAAMAAVDGFKRPVRCPMCRGEREVAIGADAEGAAYRLCHVCLGKGLMYPRHESVIFSNIPPKPISLDKERTTFKKATRAGRRGYGTRKWG